MGVEQLAQTPLLAQRPSPSTETLLGCHTAGLLLFRLVDAQQLQKLREAQRPVPVQVHSSDALGQQLVVPLEHGGGEREVPPEVYDLLNTEPVPRPSWEPPVVVVVRVLDSLKLFAGENYPGLSSPFLLDEVPRKCQELQEIQARRPPSHVGQRVAHRALSVGHADNERGKILRSCRGLASRFDLHQHTRKPSQVSLHHPTTLGRVKCLGQYYQLLQSEETAQLLPTGWLGA
mmetsp:Transcript_35871/g.86328  ORF Transcript_35871/g.86328 Transcript_35871/m.86328 type:complete len:232 (+) Transcript_35871:650-1345(+)